MKAASYRKRPIVVEAVRYDGSPGSAAFLVEWSRGKVNADVAMSVTTLEGEMRFTEGDYVIRGVEGEFYPCKRSVFEASYEEVTPAVEEPGAQAGMEKRIRERVQARVTADATPEEMKAVVSDVLLDEFSVLGMTREQASPLVSLLTASMKVTRK